MKTKGLAIRLFAALLLVLCCRAQAVAQEDTNSVIGLNRKAWEVKGNDLERSKKYAEQAIRIADRLNYRRGLSYSYNIFGNYYKQKALYDSSLFYYLKSLAIRENLRDTLNIARSYRNILGIEERLGNNAKAAKTAWEALNLLGKKKADPEIQKEKAWIMTHLGVLCYRNGDIVQALSQARNAKELFTHLEDEEGLALACMNLGFIYDGQKLYSKALEEYTSAIPLLTRLDNQEALASVYNNIGEVYYNTGKLGDAFFYYRKGLKIREEYGFEDDLNGSLLNMGIIYDELKKYDSAVFYYRKALNLSTRSGDKEVQYESHRALGNLLYDKGEYRASLHHLRGAEALADKVEQITENNLLFNELSKTYSALGNADSALFYSNQYSKVNDSLNEILRQSIALKSTIDEQNYQLRKRDYELRLSDEQGKRLYTTIIGTITALGLLLIIFLLYARFARSQRSMQELKEQVKDKELKALDAMLEGQQEERKRLATELHDTIGSMLSATKYSFKAMEKSMERMVEENKSQYQKINSMLDETMESVRRISHNMASGLFAEKGIEGALSELCQTFAQSGGINIHLNVYGFDQSLEYNTEVNIYRIIQELLTNIIKHANAGEVTIQLIRSSENINLTVEDDGRGFDPAEARKRKGMGLSNVELRVKKLSGQWNIDSGKGRGTTVIIDIPVTKTI